MKTKKAARAGQYACALLAVLLIIFPIYWIFISAFKPPEEILTYPPRLFPARLTLQNFVTAFTAYDIPRFALNSLIVTLSTMVLTVAISAMAAYALCFFRFRPAKAIHALLYLLQVLPTVTLLVPLFTLFRLMGLQNTHASLIITYTASVTGIPIALVLICGYFSGIPGDLFEAAHIDGASPTAAFFRILLPLGAPGLVCTAIYIFVQTWQEFLFAVNLITRQEMYTLPVGLQSFVGMRGTDWGGMMATSVVIALPAVVLFVCVQNYFVDNLAGSVKE